MMETLILSVLALTSIVSLTFIVERGLALRWKNVVPYESNPLHFRKKLMKVYGVNQG